MPASTKGDVTSALARQIRRDVLRMTHTGRSSHVGSCLSLADVLAVLYGGVAQLDPARPDWPDRDRIILSKGHAGAAMYSALARSGFFPVEELSRHYANGSNLSGHVSHKGVPGVELSTGSLGHGLPVGVGMALAAIRRRANHRVFVILGDGECDEGTTWESAMLASHLGLGQLAVIIDANGLQSIGPTSETVGLEPLADKWRAFGWDAVDLDGHDHDALLRALAAPAPNGQPRCVIARTTKGKGVSFMEGSVLWHYRAPDLDELAAALAEIDA